MIRRLDLGKQYRLNESCIYSKQFLTLVDKNSLLAIENPQLTMAEVTRQYKYDFYLLCHCDNDRDYEISCKILEYLEIQTISNRKMVGYHEQRDAEAGRSHFENIGNAIKNSKVVFVLISNEAVTDAWWKNTGHMNLSYRIDNPELQGTVIPVCLPQFNLKSYPFELNHYEPMYYEEDDQSSFWTKLARCVRS